MNKEQPDSIEQGRENFTEKRNPNKKIPNYRNWPTPRPGEEIKLQPEQLLQRKDSKLDHLLEMARDMTPKERALNPKKAALFNWAFVQTLPTDLKQFYIDNSELEVDRWKPLSSKWGGGYVTYAYGEVCYKEGEGRTYLSPETIEVHFELENADADRASMERFGKLTFNQIQHDITIAAMLKGYRPPPKKAS